MRGVEIRDIQASEVATAARVLARAFTTNPGMQAIFDDVSDEQRIDVLERLYLRFVESCRIGAVARCAVRDGKLLGAQLAYEPEQFPPEGDPGWMMLRGVFETGLHYVHRIVIADLFLRSRHIAEPHCYLFMLGVDPSAQGLGLGGALLRDFNQRAISRGVDAYLETDRPAAMAIYHRDHYRILREEVFNLQGNTRTWFMLKPLSTLEEDERRRAAH
ncbi:MAG: GNAT family N-acetyltransferase [Polyangiaceae bacterium]